MRAAGLVAVGVCTVVGLAFLWPSHAQEKKVDPQAGLLKPLAYPGAKRYDDSPGGPGILQARYTTADRPEKVSAWYRKAIDYAGPDGSETGASELLVNPIRDDKSGYRASAQYVTRQPGKNPGEIGDARPVSEIVLVKRTLATVAVIVISRAAGEERTYITLTIVDNMGR